LAVCLLLILLAAAAAYRSATRAARVDPASALRSE
jgi:ABC-type lipoprotein release transport system permease subunit